MPLRSISIAAIFICIFLLVKFLDVTQSILIPFIFAILIWNLLSTTAHFFQRVPVIGQFIPHSIAVLISCFLTFWIFLGLGTILTENTQKIISSTASLQNKISMLLKSFFNQGYADVIQNILGKVNVQEIILGFYSAISNLMSSVFLMFLFVVFFFIEQNYFSTKLEKMFPKKQEYTKAINLLKTIPMQIQFYLGLKTFFSAFTGFIIYLILEVMGVDFAPFWGILVFFMNFIPNIGSIVMTIIITVVAYFQWMDIGKVTILFLAQLGVHVLIGNFLETHYLGRTMHLSPLFILISLCFWGMIWGGTGLFLAVPMTVLLMIVLGSFESTRVFALMLSEKGELPQDCYLDS